MLYDVVCEDASTFIKSTGLVGAEIPMVDTSRSNLHSNQAVGIPVVIKRDL